MILKLNYTEKRRNLSFYENMWFKKEFHRYQFYSKKQFGLFKLQQFISCSFRVLYKWVGELICLVLCCFFNIQFGLAFSWLLVLLIQTGFWISFKRFWFQLFFFSVWVFFHKHSRITGLQEKGEEISLTPHYHFHPLHRHLGISWEIAGGGSPLLIASSRTRTGNL